MMVTNDRTSYAALFFSLQGRTGDKGQKGEQGSGGIDVYPAIKVYLLFA